MLQQMRSKAGIIWIIVAVAFVGGFVFADMSGLIGRAAVTTSTVVAEVNGEDILYTTRVPYARRWTGTGRLTPGRWHDFALHVLWSRDPSKGFVEVWFDGEQVLPRVMTATLLDENEAFFQIGLMRATSEVPETIIIDHVIEATTLEEVTPPRLAENRKSTDSK